MHRRFTFGTPNRAGFDPAAMRVLDKHRRLFNAYVDLHNKYLERTAEALDIVIPTDRPSTLERATWHAAARAAAASQTTKDNRAALREGAACLGADVYWQNRRAIWDRFFRLHLTATRDLKRLQPKAPAVTPKIKGNFTYRPKRPLSPSEFMTAGAALGEQTVSPLSVVTDPGSKHALLRMPIDKLDDARGNYIYGEWPFVMHRQLPDDCQVHEVNVSGTQHGALWRQEVSFLVSVPTPALTPAQGRPHAALDVGWRMTHDGLLVTTTLIGDQITRFVLPLSIVADFAYLENVDAELTRTSRAAVASPSGEVPSQSWRALLRASRTGAGLNPAQLTSIRRWALHTRSLRHESQNLWARLSRERLALYRKYANTLCSTVSRIAVERLNLRALMFEDAQLPIHRSQQSMAAVSELLRCVREAAESHGIAVVQVSPHLTTRQHIACGHINPPATGAVVHCKGCGLAYDPDENAARQIAQRAFGPQSADRLNMSRPDAATPAVPSQAPEAHLSTESVDNRA
ncbi:zinc ribbon domain-containing protein [Ottowia flava]|uniref:Zinc ribbon domain-containing protein n=2 Tax=Ottowia flava TaxID=2675430 RepID=A0ABW4KZC8_9BURK|nr:zinc ribbon domain-containing protein [Ottowia sp. GY511]